MLKNYTKVKVDEFGDKHYLNDKGKEHRLDGPAIENSDGSKFWYINGTYHRNIGPSDEYRSGSKFWLFKGKYHRIGGLVNFNINLWYICGARYKKQEYYKKIWDI